MILTGGGICTRPVGWLATSAVPAKAHVHGNTSAYGVRSRTRDRVTEQFEADDKGQATCGCARPYLVHAVR